eukprot:Gb_07352 [translate_table: standard]
MSSKHIQEQPLFARLLSTANLFCARCSRELVASASWSRSSRSRVCKSNSSLTANAMCFVLITVSSSFSRPSSCSFIICR